MPTRLVRDGILESRPINALSDSAQILYFRLILVADDFGRFVADPGLIRARCFPLQVDLWPPARVAEALAEISSMLDDAGSPLILVYSYGSKQYLEIQKFDQRLRNMKSRYPAPQSNDLKMPVIRPSNDGPVAVERPSSGTPEVEVEVEVEVEEEPEEETHTQEETEKRVRKFTPPKIMDRKVSGRFPEWWALWVSGTGMSANEVQAGMAWTSVVFADVEERAFECTRSYLARSSVIDRRAIFNPENFLFIQARNEFKARWPPKARDPARREVLSVTSSLAAKLREEEAKHRAANHH